MTLLFGFALRISGILLAALAAMALSRGHSAALRHWILTVALICVAVTPVVTWFAPRIVHVGIEIPESIVHSNALDSDPVLKAPPIVKTEPKPFPMAAQEKVVHLSETNSDVGRTTTPTLPAENESALRSAQSIQTDLIPDVKTTSVSSSLITAESILITVWLIGVFAGFISLVSGVVQIRRIARDSSILNEPRWVQISEEIFARYGLKRQVEILECNDGLALATWGLIHPKLLLPTGAAGWPDERIRMVLCHELAHIRRRDWPIQLLAEVERAVFWFNPLCWIARSRLVQESEQACDDAVLVSGISGADYAEQLLAFASPVRGQERIWSATLSMARQSTLEQRFVAILDPAVHRGTARRIPAIVTTMIFLTIALLLGSLHVSAERAAAILAPAPIQSPVHATIMNALSEVALPLVFGPQAAPNTIQGVVVKWGTNDPIADVDVELIRVEGTSAHPLGPPVYPPGLFSPGGRVQPTYPNPGDISHARTKGDGRFLFTNLFPGKYKLWAARADSAYYTAEYGQRDPRGPGMNFQFVDGQAINDLKLPMAANGTISGIVFDADGMPAAHVRVMAFEATFNAGRRLFQLTEGTETDDRGAYRLFFLPPGKYTIAARPEDPRRRYAALASPLSASTLVQVETHAEAPILFRVLDSGNVIEETYTLAYYGGGTDPQNARLIDLKTGTNVDSIDIPLRAARMRAVHIRGIVTDSMTGKPASGAFVRAVPAVWSPSLIVPSVSSDSNGRFDIPGVGSGSYTLVANLRANGMFQNGVTGIDVNESDIDGLDLVVSSGTTISGHISVEGITAGGLPPDISAMTVVLSPEHPNLPGASSGTIRDGAFTITGVQPGTYKMFINPVLAEPGFPAYTRVQTVPAAMQRLYVKSIHLGAEDALSGSVHVANSPPREIAIVLGMNGGSIEGTVFDLRQQHQSNAVVALVPDSQSLRNRTDLYRSAVTDADGKFSIQGIAAGTYKLFSWDYASNGAWFDANFLGSAEARGKTVSVIEGNKQSVALTVIGASQ